MIRPAPKIQFLRNILLIVIFIAVSLGLYNNFVIYPSFISLLVQYTKIDAVRVAHYLSETLSDNEALSRENLDASRINRLHQMEGTLELVKLKIYSPTGETIYSTDVHEIGVINQSVYFQKLAATGSSQAQIVKRDSLSLEGKKVKADVVEVYVPLKNGSTGFSGAVEIYYDMSRRKKIADRLIAHSTVVLLALAGGLIAVILLLFIKESRVEKERRYGRQQIEKGQERLRTILDAIPDMILLIDRSYQLIWCNKRARDFLGDRIAGGEENQTFSLENAAWLPTGVKACFSLGNACEEEVQLTDRRGKILIFSSVANGVDYNPAEQGGKPELVLLIFRDITEKKILEEEAVRAGQLAAIGELAAGVAHEINNPINGIMNCSQLLLDDQGAGHTTRDLARRMYEAGDRVAMIVRSLLSFARVDSHEPVWSDIEELIESTLELTSAQIEKDGIDLQVDIAEALPPLFIHPQQIQQVFLNILSNSRYAINMRRAHEKAAGIIQVSTAVKKLASNRIVEIAFTDNGTGIPADDMGSICKPFFTTKPTGEGTGLGLSISQSIVENHGGTLTISNTESPGCLTIVSLPISEGGTA